MRHAALLAATLFATSAVPALVLAQDTSTAPAASPAATPGVNDTQLEAFATAMVKVREISATVENGTPNAEQQAGMAQAIEASSLTITQFNAISTQVSASPVMRARLVLIGMDKPAAGTVAAGVTDAEVNQFSAAMVRIRELAPAGGATPTAEQQAEMAGVLETSGLEIDRFNAIAMAVSSDPYLRARVELADARRGQG